MSLEAEIDQFYLGDEEEKQEEQVVKVPNFEDELNRVSGLHPSGLEVVHPDDSLEDEEEKMALNQRKGLRDLMAGRNKGSSFKEVPKFLATDNLPPPPLLLLLP